MALAVALTAGCSSTGNTDTYSASGVRAAYRELERLTEARDMAVMDLYHPDYLDNGWTFIDVQDDFVQFFRDYRDIDEHFNILDISLVNGLAYVTFENWFQARGAYDGVLYVSDVETYGAVWKYEYGDWYLYGNQRSSAALKNGTLLHFKRERRPVK
jgi:hypothetical protein